MRIITPEEQNTLEVFIKQRVRLERLFLESEEGNAIQNRHGVYSYQSKCGNHILSLDHFLAAYKEWLIEKGFIKEL